MAFTFMKHKPQFSFAEDHFDRAMKSMSDSFAAFSANLRFPHEQLGSAIGPVALAPRPVILPPTSILVKEAEPETDQGSRAMTPECYAGLLHVSCLDINAVDALLDAEYTIRQRFAALGEEDIMPLPMSAEDMAEDSDFMALAIEAHMPDSSASCAGASAADSAADDGYDSDVVFVSEIKAERKATSRKSSTSYSAPRTRSVHGDAIMRMCAVCSCKDKDTSVFFNSRGQSVCQIDLTRMKKEGADVTLYCSSCWHALNRGMKKLAN